MNTRQKVLQKGMLSTFLALALASQAALVLAAEPTPTMKSEEAAHPRMVLAIHQMNKVLDELRAAPHDFGGNKAAAMKDTEQAVHSLKKALYYRLKLDDTAIEKAQP